MNDSRSAFPDGIRALVVESDEKFQRSASLMLSLLNYRVATCESPASAVKLLNGRLRDADVVFIDALRATTCGFDFRGIVEHHLCIPVIYLFSFDYNVAGDVAEALRRNAWAATYVIKKPLDAEDLGRLWRIILWSKLLLRGGEKTLPWLEWPRGNQALPTAVQALLPSSSTAEGQGGEEEDDGNLFKVVRAGRGRRRKLGDSHNGGSSSRGRGRGRGRGGIAGSLERGQPTRRLAEQMNVTEEQEINDDDDVVPSYQQPAQQNQRGVQGMGVQNQPHSWSLFMQPLPRMLNMPHNNPMIFTDAAGPSSSNVAAFAGASNTSAPALLPRLVYQAPARAPSPAPHGLYSAQPPLVYQQPPVAAAMAQRGRRRKLGDSHDGGSSSRGRGRGGLAASLEIRGQPTRSLLAEQMNVTSEGQESDEEDVVPSHQQLAQRNGLGVQVMHVQNQQHGRSLFLQPVPEMLNAPHINPMISPDAAGPSSSNATAFTGTSYISTPALLSAYQAPSGARPTSQEPALGLPPVHHQQQQLVALHDFGNMVALAPPVPAVPTMAATSGHQPHQLLQLTLNQQQLQHDMFAEQGQGAADVGTSENAVVAQLQSPNVGAQPEPADGFDDVLGAMMEMNDTFPHYDENMETMFSSYQYDENAMLSLDALWDFNDDVPMHPEGQQDAAADCTAAANTTGIMPNGGASGSSEPNLNMGAAHDGLDILEEYLKDGNESDLMLLQDKKNGHH